MPYIGGSGGMSTGAWNPPQPPANNPGYRGGSFGMEQDFGIRNQGFDAALNYFMRNQQNEWDAAQQSNSIAQQGRNSIIANASGMTTAADKERARGDLQQSLSDWAGLRDTGGFGEGEFERQMAARVARVNMASEAAKKNFNATMAARGLGGNAGAIAALGMAGDFQAAGEAGQAESQLESERRAAKERGISGYSGVSSQLANIALTPTQEAALRLSGMVGGGGGSGGSGGPAFDPNAIRNMAQEWMNMQVGPSGFNWQGQSGPVRPQYPTGATSIPSGRDWMTW